VPATVHPKDIVEALEIQFDERPAFLDRDTGEVYTVSTDLLHLVEECADDEEPGLPEWQYPEWEIAKQVVFEFGVRFLKLPTKYEVHEWAIMEEFADSVESGRIRSDLLHAIHGPGAFRMFKDTLRRHRIEPAWFAFRDEALRAIAIGWCKEHHIVWE
jgi:hypothetical protein